MIQVTKSLHRKWILNYAMEITNYWFSAPGIHWWCEEIYLIFFKHTWIFSHLSQTLGSSVGWQVGVPLQIPVNVKVFFQLMVIINHNFIYHNYVQIWFDGLRQHR